MTKEEIENYISELESMFELSELENHSRNILKVGIYIKQLQQENQELKLELSGYRQAILKDKEMLGLKEENDKLKKQLEEYKKELETWKKKYGEQ